MKNSIKNHNLNKKRIKEVINYVKEIGGIDYTIEKLNEFHNQALKDLEKFPKNKYRDHLKSLVDYVIDRKY